MIKTRRKFISKTFKNPRTVAAFAPMSTKTIEKLSSHIPFDTARCIVEYGPGHGNITQYILKNMHADASLTAFEVMQEFVDELSHIQDKRFSCIHDTASCVADHLALGSVDVVVSTVPFSVMSVSERDRILQETSRVLKPGGLFITAQYSTYNKKEFSAFIGPVEVFFSPMNMPPVFILCAVKR